MSCWRQSLHIAANAHGCAGKSSLHPTRRLFLTYLSGQYYGECKTAPWPSTSVSLGIQSNTTILNYYEIQQKQTRHKDNYNHQSKRTISQQVLVPKVKASCPFKTLNISKDATYSHAKKAFLKIAMKHHPDTVGNDCEKTRQRSQEIFMRCRKALEALVECDETGKCLLRTEVDQQEEHSKRRKMTDDEFDNWFEKETGHKNAFQFDLDPATMREVASMHDDMEGSHGLDRDGGMWHLASMISSAVKSGKEGAESVLKLEAGKVRPGDEVEARGKLERRRKRVRGRR